ncbi:hypothetical protein GMES_3126 [Paraglaciecola mesophila KMM 241]|uniref:Uncharacterized protein n=1 Tax=Paraglaciecola mesophila KMM 241 TaxID=1128912 RepID=K6XXU1_9ALTE|nr:hypothetical protein GMES_3126 [Paraglaciecola mesophila KMM 241]
MNGNQIFCYLIKNQSEKTVFSIPLNLLPMKLHNIHPIRSFL